MADLCFCSFSKIPDKPMTQATAVAVHFYSLLMTWGQAAAQNTSNIDYHTGGWVWGLLSMHGLLCIWVGFGLGNSQC